MENSQKPQTKTIVGLACCIVVLVLTVLGLVVAYYFQSDHVVSLEYQVSSLRTSAKDAQKEAKKSEATPVAVAYREIPELGVKYKLTDETKDLTYSIMTNENGQIRVADFSTVAMSAMKGSGGDFPCTSPHAPSGGLTLYMNGNEVIQGGRMVKDVAKKVGNYYYLYAHPQFACSVNGQTVKGLETSIDAVKAAFDSLEAM